VTDACTLLLGAGFVEVVGKPHCLAGDTCARGTLTKGAELRPLRRGE